MSPTLALVLFSHSSTTGWRSKNSGFFSSGVMFGSDASLATSAVSVVSECLRKEVMTAPPQIAIRPTASRMKAVGKAFLVRLRGADVDEALEEACGILVLHEFSLIGIIVNGWNDAGLEQFSFVEIVD